MDPELFDRELQTLELLKGDLALCGSREFGQLSFPVVCRDSLQATFDLAVSLLHSFEYDEAEKVFAGIIAVAPECVMAYWGVAMSNVHPLWAPPGLNALKKGARAVALAATLPQTTMEQEYISAIAAFYKNYESESHAVRSGKFKACMANIHRRYPDDVEAATFYALALIATAEPTDKTYHNQLLAGEVLERIFNKYPDHPGIAHYLIHAYDYPRLAQKAMHVAEKYAHIAPSSAHAQHMPSHIFTTLGMWDASIASNLQSTESAVCYIENLGRSGHWDEELHGMDYLAYAYLQTGETHLARDLEQYLMSFDSVWPVNFKVAYAAAAIPARIALETRDWKRASALMLPECGIPWEQFPWQEAIVHFARGLGFAHTDSIDQAKISLATLNNLRDALYRENDTYKTNQVEIQISILRAWIAEAEGHHVLAETLMREAADAEDLTDKHPVTPAEVLPARELLGDLFMLHGKHTLALEAYGQSLIRRPNRQNGLYGAGRAAVQTGNYNQARSYYKQLLDQIHTSEHERAEITEVRRVLKDLINE